MKNYLGILLTDAKNRDGYIVPFPVLAKSVAENALAGMPSLIDHDFHKPLGWIFPFGVFIEPGISKVVGNSFLCTEEGDSKLIFPKIAARLEKLNTEDCAEHIVEFKELLGEEYSERGKFISKGCVAYTCPGITSKIFTALFENVDKSGLVNLDEILKDFDYAGSGIFKSKNSEFSIYCHQYFNRNLSLSNNFNTYFIDEFLKLKSNTEVTLRIAIDENILGLSKTFMGVLEFDYWWGPKFDDDVSTLPNQVTKYECNEDQKFFSDVSGTEFWWKTDNDTNRVLEVEEIRERPSFGIGKDAYGCRYIHSIYDTKHQLFKHFDGAVRVYSEDKIMERWGVDISKAGKDTIYKKLFRVDGKLPLADWKKLCILYFKGNPLLFEYFGAKEEYESLQQPTVAMSVESELIPNKITVDDGIRLFASYHAKDEPAELFERKIVVSDVINSEQLEPMDVVEYDVIEIKKALMRIGQDLHIPSDINFIKPYDFYTNYPIILHGKENTASLIEGTLKAFKMVFDSQHKYLNKSISFTLGWEMEGFETRLSFFGKCTELLKWLQINSSLPVVHDDFLKWLEVQRKWIYENYNGNNKDFNHLLKTDGVLYIKRTPILPKDVKFFESEQEISYKLLIQENSEVGKLLSDGKLFSSHVVLIEEATCSKTKENYFTSATSKFLDEDVSMELRKVDLLGFFWTDEAYY